MSSNAYEYIAIRSQAQKCFDYKLKSFCKRPELIIRLYPAVLEAMPLILLRTSCAYLVIITEIDKSDLYATSLIQSCGLYIHFGGLLSKIWKNFDIPLVAVWNNKTWAQKRMYRFPISEIAFCAATNPAHSKSTAESASKTEVEVSSFIYTFGVKFSDWYLCPDVRFLIKIFVLKRERRQEDKESRGQRSNETQ